MTDQADQLTPTGRVADALSTAGGRVLAAATQVVALCRRAAKPLHPSGDLRYGRVERTGADGSATGVPWLDEPGEDRAVVRLSRAIGLPDGVPDIHGLALRVRHADGPADVLFATTGTGRLTRFLLTPSRRPHVRPMTTLLPYRSPTGPLLLAARSLDPDTYRLSWARPGGDWVGFATLLLEADPGQKVADLEDEDPQLSFDPVLNRLDRLDQYDPVLRLREPAYRRARRSRSDSNSSW